MPANCTRLVWGICSAICPGPQSLLRGGHSLHQWPAPQLTGASRHVAHGQLGFPAGGQFHQPSGILEWETKQAECHCSRATRREHLHCAWQRPVGCRKGPWAHQEAVGSGGRLRRVPSMAPVLLPAASLQPRPSAPFRYLLLHCTVKIFKLKVQRIEQAHTSFT